MSDKRIWSVWCPDYGADSDDAKTVTAGSAQEAAEQWAERSDYDSADYSIVKGMDVTVHVNAPGCGTRRFIVTGESVPVYTARLITEKGFV